MTVARASEAELKKARLLVEMAQATMRQAGSKKLAATREYEDAARVCARLEADLERLEDAR